MTEDFYKYFYDKSLTNKEFIEAWYNVNSLMHEVSYGSHNFFEYEDYDDEDNENIIINDDFKMIIDQLRSVNLGTIFGKVDLSKSYEDIFEIINEPGDNYHYKNMCQFEDMFIERILKETLSPERFTIHINQRDERLYNNRLS